MSIENLRQHYKRTWHPDTLWDAKKAFTDALIANHDREILEFHYSLLEDRTHFYTFCSIRAALKKHGPAGEAFLIEMFPNRAEAVGQG